jgi:hypothetical protein
MRTAGTAAGAAGAADAADAAAAAAAGARSIPTTLGDNDVWAATLRPCIPPERLLASAFRSPRMALGLVERPSWLFRPAFRQRSESARAGSEKSLQIIFPME